jgi:beta-galactosidase
MFDFAADARREGGKNGINDKGLVTRDRATVKDAFWFFKANWSAEPVVHVCSKRMTETTNAVATVVGFSNRSAVELAVNGVTFGIQDPDEVKLVQWNDVPLTPGDNVIELRAGGLSDTRALRRK